MPTRIVLDVSDKRAPHVPPSKKAPFLLDEENGIFPPDRVTTATRRKQKESKKRDLKTSNRDASKRIVSFRSSIFREKEQDNVVTDTNRGLSSTDIRASPRLIGYIYQLLASTVLLISVVKFYRNSEDEQLRDIAEKLKENFGEEIFNSVAGPVYLWKLVGCSIVGSIGAGVNLLIPLAHFDTVCFPRFWVAIFRDGSQWEQNLLRFMLLFWAVSLHVCTSSLSVGEVQGNVYFTTWIAFAASALNYGVWRTSSGLPSWAEKLSLHHRETTYNWLWLVLFITIFAGASTDIYFNRNVLNLRFGAKDSDLSDQDWRVVLCIIWCFLAIALASVLLNHYSTQSMVIRFGVESRIILGWRHFEGFIILLMIGVFFFLLIKHTGVDGVVNGLTNTYFSIWGCFFNSVFLFGTWLRENKNIEAYIVGDDNEAGDGTGSAVKRGVTFEPGN